MITITVADRSLVDQVHAVMEKEIHYNPNLNGAEYRVIDGEHNSIHGADEIVGAILYNAIFRS